MNHYLKFQTKIEMEDFILPLVEKHEVDIIGQIAIPAQYNEAGVTVAPSETKDGWHVNFLGDLPEELLPFEVFPETPYRIWA